MKVQNLFLAAIVPALLFAATPSYANGDVGGNGQGTGGGDIRGDVGGNGQDINKDGGQIRGDVGGNGQDVNGSGLDELDAALGNQDLIYPQQ